MQRALVMLRALELFTQTPDMQPVDLHSDRGGAVSEWLFAGLQTIVDRPELRRPFREIRPTFARSSASLPSSTN